MIPHYSSSFQRQRRRGSLTKLEDPSPHHQQNSMSSSSSSVYFDHVLIDVQHILHVVIRKSHNDTHAIQLLTRELDSCIELAIPTVSLVLALDGSSCAAKKSTQKQRRRAIIKRSIWLQMKLPLLIQSLNRHQQQQQQYKNYNLTSSLRFQAWKRKLQKDTRALCITPGHDFMDQASKTCQQWACNTVHGTNIQYHVSTSYEQGEGELKLLYWLLQQHQKKQSSSYPTTTSTVAFMGGDSDLVLLGLAIPINTYHHVSIILPSESSYYKSYILHISYFMQCIESLLSPPPIIHHRRRPPPLSNREWYYVKLDLILLFIMNGNDYLPKLRGSPGLHIMFQVYISLLKKELYEDDSSHHDDNNARTTSTTNTSPTITRARKRSFFFLQAETQTWNIPFCQLYFMELAPASCMIVQQEYNSENDYNNNNNDDSNSLTPLSCLQNLVNIGILPGPIVFDIDTILQEKVQVDKEEETNYNSCKVEEEQKILRLTLGTNHTTDSDSFQYKIFMKKDASKKKTKQILAQIALDHLFGNNTTVYMDIFSSLDDNHDHLIGVENNTLLNYMEESHGMIIPSMKDSRDNNNTLFLVANTSQYLQGLQWNLKMYQEGICSDYEYHYSYRSAPTVHDLLYHFSGGMDNIFINSNRVEIKDV